MFSKTEERAMVNWEVKYRSTNEIENIGFDSNKRPPTAWTANKGPLRAEGLITAPIFILWHRGGKASLSAGNIKEVNGY